MDFDVKLRPAMPDDWDDIVEVHRQAIFGKAAAYYSEGQLSAWANSMMSFDNDELMRYIAEIDGKVVGFVSASPERNLLRSLYVAPGAWRGVGKRLLAVVEQDAAQKGALFLLGETSSNAVEFYRKCGYDIGGSSQHQLSDGSTIPCYVIRKELKS